jgi:hypothetical protein
VRIYIPVLLSSLREVLRSRSVTPRGGIVFAVTSDLRAEYPEADDEELEYLAMSDAATACLRLLAAAGPAEPPLRVVIAADVSEAVSASNRDRAAATVSGAVPWSQIASVHLDDRDAAEVVRAAAAVVDQADLGDDDAEFAVGSAQDIELAWYAPSEVAYLMQFDELDDDERPAGQES